jgi:hypothetical protein
MHSVSEIQRGPKQLSKEQCRRVLADLPANRYNNSKQSLRMKDTGMASKIGRGSELVCL